MTQVDYEKKDLEMAQYWALIHIAYIAIGLWLVRESVIGLTTEAVASDFVYLTVAVTTIFINSRILKVTIGDIRSIKKCLLEK